MFWKNPTVEYLTMDFVVDILFLGAVHSYLPIGLLFLPATTDWLRQRRAAKRFSFLLLSLFLSFLLLSFFLWRGLTFGENTVSRHTIIALVGLVLVGASLQHTLWQVKGLMLTLKHQSSQSSAKENFNPPKFFFKSLHTPFYILLALGLLMPTLQLAVKADPNLESTLPMTSLGIATSLLMLSVLAVFVFPYLTAKHSGTKVQGLYALRIVAWTLSPLSRYGALAAAAIHGIEYLFVMLQLFKNEARKILVRTALVVVPIAIVLRFAVTKFSFAPGEASFAIIALNALGLTIGTVHFYWDRVLFAMRDSETREFTGRLLSEK